MTRYDVDAAGAITKGPELSFQSFGVGQANSTRSVVFLSDTKAYVLDDTSLQAIVWNPSTGATTGQTIDLSEEYEPSQTDSGRLLAAGAQRSFWLRAPSGHVHEAADLIRKIIDQHENTIVESNSILDSLDPDVYLQVLDFGCEDFKASAAR